MDSPEKRLWGCPGVGLARSERDIGVFSQLSLFLGLEGVGVLVERKEGVEKKEGEGF